jgi:6,7-dimethyl-8-ribityllumazine synthase
MSEPYDRTRWESDDRSAESATDLAAPDDDLEAARENVFDGWPSSEDVAAFASRTTPPADEPAPTEIHSAEDFALAEAEYEAAAAEPAVMDEEPEPAEPVDEPGPAEVPEELEPVALVDSDQVSHEHAPGELDIPPGYGVLEGNPDGTRRAVAVVVSRFNGEITSRLLASALEELERAGVEEDAITVMPVPGAFELPIGSMALARTRRFACIVALGCVIRGETPHFDYVASEAASGLQLAALETGVPVAFGVLTLERADQAEARIEKGAEAVRTALEMADLFSHLRAAAAR